MAMFGGMTKMPGYGFGQFSPPLVEDQTGDLSRQPSMFGGMNAGAGMAPVKPAALAGFTPYRPGLLDKAGLIGDILSGGQAGQQMLAQKQGQAALAYSAAHPAPLVVGAKAFDPVTHEVIADGTKAPEEDDFTRTLRAAGIDPTSPQAQALYRQKAQNTVDPIHAYPTTDANGNEGLIFKRPSEMGGQTGAQPVQVHDVAGYAALPPGAPYIDPNGQHRVKGGGTTGGAAPATGPGGFPLYPAGHGRSGTR